MFYEVRARLLFTKADEAADFYHDCKLALAKSAVINPDSENIEFSTLEAINNNHDHEPNQPCELTSYASNKPEQ